MPVSFSTTAGNLSSAFVTTDANGVATTVLHTATQAVVTASVGAAGLGRRNRDRHRRLDERHVVGHGDGRRSTARRRSVITPPSSGATAGLPATFTFAVTAAATNGSAIKDVMVNWGDGRVAGSRRDHGQRARHARVPVGRQLHDHGRC